MTRWYDNFIDSTLTRLGYVKASSLPVSVAWAGEAPVSRPTGYGEYGAEEWEKLAVTCSWVYSDVRAIANEGSAAPINVYTKSGEGLQEEIDHPFEQLMQRPNKFMGGAWLLQYTLWWWLLRGEAYWMKVPTNAGELAELWPLPSTRMQPIPDGNEYISGYLYTPRHGRKAVTLPVEQICYFRFPNPFDYHRGLSPLTAYRLALQADIAAVKWNADTFKNDVVLRTLISLPKEMSKPDFTARSTEIQEQLIDQQRRFMIARAGDIKAEQLSLSPKDMEYLAGREFTREEIDRVFGIPAGYWAKDATRANAEAAKATMISQAVWPLLTLMHDEITAQVVKPHYGEELVAKFEDIRPRDRRLALAEQKQAQVTRTLNEARKARDEEEYQGPFADVIAELPVPLATNAQFVMAVTGLGGLMGGGFGGFGEPEKALREDLRKWQSIELRRFREGKLPGEYQFETDVIPAEQRRAIYNALAKAGNEEEVKAAFAAGFQPSWEGYP